LQRDSPYFHHGLSIDNVRIASESSCPLTVVTVVTDSGLKYLSTDLYR
jgi:hypothetical protein